MRAMQRNKQKFWYALYERSEPTLDEYGNEVGEKPIYGNPIKESGNISEADGNTEKALFGINAVYTKVINPMPKNFPMNENSILWVDTVPRIAEDGRTDAPHDYVVTKVARSLNHKAYALKKVNVSIGGDGV